MTALENVALPLELRGEADAVERCRAICSTRSASRIAPIISRPSCPAASSSAWRSRGRSSPAPQSCLADEPTGNLDGKTGRQVVDLLFGLARAAQATLVLVTHDENLASRCERIIRMADGRVVEAGEPIFARAEGAPA